MTASLTKVAIFIIFSLSEKLDLRMVGTAFANLGIWPGGGRRILRVSVRLSLVEDMSQEQREVVDPKLFMGDRGEG